MKIDRWLPGATSVIAMLSLTAASAPLAPMIRDDIRRAMSLEAAGRELNLLLAERARRAGNAAEATSFEQAASFNQSQFLAHVETLERDDGDGALREALETAIAQRAFYASAVAHARALGDEVTAQHFEQLRLETAKQRDLLGDILKKRLAARQ